MKALSFRTGGKTHALNAAADVITQKLEASISKDEVTITMLIRHGGARTFGIGFALGFFIGVWFSVKAAFITGAVFGVIGWTQASKKVSHRMGITGATLERVDESRSAATAAGGALAGGLLLGPLGLVAGAVLGAGKTHTLVLRQGDDFLVFEASTSELQGLVGRGLALPTA